jgi:hypothetical protein
MNFKDAMLSYLSEKSKSVNWLAKKLDVSVQTIYAKKKPQLISYVNFATCSIAM